MGDKALPATIVEDNRKYVLLFIKIKVVSGYLESSKNKGRRKIGEGPKIYNLFITFQ